MEVQCCYLLNPKIAMSSQGVPIEALDTLYIFLPINIRKENVSVCTDPLKPVGTFDEIYRGNT